MSHLLLLIVLWSKGQMCVYMSIHLLMSLMLSLLSCYCPHELPIKEKSFINIILLFCLFYFFVLCDANLFLSVRPIKAELNLLKITISSSGVHRREIMIQRDDVWSDVLYRCSAPLGQNRPACFIPQPIRVQNP